MQEIENIGIKDICKYICSRYPEAVGVVYLKMDNDLVMICGVCEKGKRASDAVFVDIRMPGMDGLEFLDKAMQFQPKLPVIIVTGHGTEDTEAEAMRIGAFAFLKKPFRMVEIEELVTRLLHYRREAGNA